MPPTFGDKQGRNYPNFRRRTVTSGEEKELLKEGRTLSDRQGFEQVLQTLVQELKMVLRGRVQSTPEVLRASLGLH